MGRHICSNGWTSNGSISGLIIAAHLHQRLHLQRLHSVQQRLANKDSIGGPIVAATLQH
jgi:hypothetical protein